MSDERQNTNEATKDIMQAVTKYFPGYADAINSKTADTAKTQLAADQAVSPGYAELAQELFKTYGPENARTAAEVEGIANKAASERELDLAQTTGRELVKEADASQRMLDGEFYQGREQLGNAIGKYINANDPNLTETESEAMRRGMGRTSFNPQSAMDTAKNMFLFGKEGQEKARSFGDVITNTAAALPAMRSTLPGFEIATRRQVGSTGQERTPTGTQGSGSQTYGMGSQLLGQVGNVKYAEMSKQKSLLENVTGWGEFGGKVIGAVGGGMMCWVAREVYGEGNLNWLLFREWLVNRSPIWFFWSYRTFGERFAKWIADKPKVKNSIRSWMDRKISTL